MAHLTIKDRTEIELMLKNGSSLSKIARELKKANSTISREIKKHTVISDKVHYHRIRNRCVLRKDCKKKHVCNKRYPHCRKKYCSLCNECNSVCPDYVEEKCTKLYSPPYVCNGCKYEKKCTLMKKFYISDVAHKDYKKVLVESREGVNLTLEELKFLDDFMSPLLLNGQSIHHICAHNPNMMIRSEKSYYRYVDASLFSAKNIDLPRVVRRKPRRTNPTQFKIDKKCYVNRTYDDFKKYVSKNPEVQIVEMDTVEGKKGGKVLLTLHFKGLCDFMLAFIREHNTAKSVIDNFDRLYLTLKPDLFKKMFGCCLTDRGSEFSNPLAIETTSENIKRTRVFYCDPQAAWQKANVELNHQLIRKFLPKGKSFDHLNQEDIDLMMNHINSYGRKKLNDKSPTFALSNLFGEEVLELLNVRIIPANEIILSPKLFKK